MEAEARARRGHGERAVRLVVAGWSAAPTRSRARARSASRSGWCGGSGAEPAGGAAVSATLLALGAIALWATLASLGVALAHVPPFLLTGLALVIGSVAGLAAGAAVAGAGVDPGARRLRPVRLPLPALRRPAQRPAGRGQPRQLPLAAAHRRARAAVPAGDDAAAGASSCAALAGFAGAALAILGGARPQRRLRLGLPAGPRLGLHLGQLLAADAARRPLPDGGVGLFGLVSGVLALLCHLAVRAAGRAVGCATGG